MERTGGFSVGAAAGRKGSALRLNNAIHNFTHISDTPFLLKVQADNLYASFSAVIAAVKVRIARVAAA